MKQLLLSCLFLLACSFYVNAQEQGTSIQNGDLEDWILDASGSYEEPSGYWATANSVSLLTSTAPITVFKETEKVKSGQFAAKMVTKLFGSLPVTGTVSTGEFDRMVVNPIEALKLGAPFTDKPTHFRGYYMYFPAEGDSADIYSQLLKFNPATQQRDTLAEALLRIKGTVDSYTHFDLPFEYYSDETPDTIVIVFASSAAGNQFMAAEGSTLYADDASLSYDVVGIDIAIPLMPEVAVKAYPNPANEELTIELAQNLTETNVTFYDAKGQKLGVYSLNQSLNKIKTKDWPKGVYFYQIHTAQRLLNGGKIEILR